MIEPLSSLIKIPHCGISCSENIDKWRMNYTNSHRYTVDILRVIFFDIAYNYVRRTTRCFKKFKKNIAAVQGCLRCIIHYDRNVMKKEIGRLTEASFSTIWRSADVRQTQEKIALRLDDMCKKLPSHFNSEIHCSHKWCYRQSTNISWMLKRKHSTGEQTEEWTVASRSSTRCPQKEKSGLLCPQKECFFVWKRSKETGIIHRWFVTSCWQSMLRKQLKNEPGKSVTSDIQT